MKDLLPHKLGANRKETARNPRKHDSNFSQSRDIREDRGARQQKFINQPKSTLTHLARDTRERGRQPRFQLPDLPATAKRTAIVKLRHPAAGKVTIAGTFNEWNPESTPLHRIGGDEWAVALSLEAGLYEYRILVDGQWVDDPAAERHVPNGLGSQNAVLKIS